MVSKKPRSRCFGALAAHIVAQQDDIALAAGAACRSREPPGPAVIVVGGDVADGDALVGQSAVEDHGRNARLPGMVTEGTSAMESNGASTMPSTPWATKSWTTLIWPSRSFSSRAPFQRMSTPMPCSSARGPP